MLFITVPCTVNTLVRKLVKVFGDFKTGGKVFRTVKHVDGLVVLQDVIDSLELEDSLEWR